MKVRNMVSALLVPVIMACTVQISFAAEWGGSGTKDDPYLISSAADWSKFRTYVNGDDDGGAGEYWKLTEDIDFTDTNGNWGWIAPVGKYDVGAKNEPAEGKMFQGNFDGDGHVIRNYTIPAVENTLGTHGAFGLFSAIGGNAVIENLGVENVSLNMEKDWIYISAGAIAGFMTDNAVIRNCYSKSVDCNQRYEDGVYSAGGGIAGAMRGNSRIEKCYSRTFDEGTNYYQYGGIAGGVYSQGAVIQNCYSDTTIAEVIGAAWNNNWYGIYYPEGTVLPSDSGTYTGDGKTGKGYIGTTVSETDLKAVPNDLRANFIADKDITNDGWPILRPLTVKMTRTDDKADDGRVGFYIEEMYLPAYNSFVVKYKDGTINYPKSEIVIVGNVDSNVTFGLQINDVPEDYKDDISVSLSKREVSGK